MPVVSRTHLAARFRQNWMAKYPLDTYGNGGMSLDDSLTSLNWLQNLNILKITTPTPPSSPVPMTYENAKRTKVNPNSVLNVTCGPPPTKMGGNHYNPPDTPPLTPTTLGGDSIDYKTNPYVKPPYSYATLICMAMKENKKSKITLSEIYNWITDNFMYYNLADPSWQNSIRHNLSLNKCFQKVPRRKDEPGKGGFWRINPEYNDMIESGVFKKRRNSRDSNPPPTPVKRIKKEEDLLPSCSGDSRTNVGSIDGGWNYVIQCGNHEDYASLKGDFTWTSILNQDIDIGGVKVKTEDLIDSNETYEATSSIISMSPPSSESNSNDFGFDELFSGMKYSDIPVDMTTNDPLDLTVVGQSIKAPEWWNESINFGDSRNFYCQGKIGRESGLHTPIAPSPVHDHEGNHPWSEGVDLEQMSTAFDVDNLFDIDNIPSPAL
ncbi:hypothetical protein CHS0354_033298 [Potamilus streckersoni]|uniref:Fork-head domain-containing protein n=1 Tax=Potamilus streckersoni TaxID=2493646 RepID=A0AAE0RTD0_9BIVA|nr:hypothetical protein CHS0354_033298 [Potamilus streckersoni]